MSVCKAVGCCIDMACPVHGTTAGQHPARPVAVGCEEDNNERNASE